MILQKRQTKAISTGDLGKMVENNEVAKKLGV
jgi:hypothetical protein